MVKSTVRLFHGLVRTFRVEMRDPDAKMRFLCREDV